MSLKVQVGFFPTGALNMGTRKPTHTAKAGERSGGVGVNPKEAQL